jgi:tetratricopeptide (TPR) repeat protein
MDFPLSSETVGALNDGFLGYLDRCGKRLAAVVAHTRNRSDLYSAAFALTHAACGHLLVGEPLAARSSAEEAIALSKEHGFEERVEIGRCIRGIALTDQGLLDEGIREICDGLSALRLAKCGIFDSWFYGALALAYGKAVRPNEGLATVDSILATIERVGGRAMYLAEIHRTRGELLLVKEGGKTAEAEKSYRTAIDLARSQRSRLLELRATRSLANLVRRTSRRAEGYAMLAEIYNSFTEGFDTADLKEVKALLDELSN